MRQLPESQIRKKTNENRTQKTTVSEQKKVKTDFQRIYTHMGAKKKLVARISKSEPLILKSKPLIFCPMKTRLKIVLKMRTNTAILILHIAGRHFSLQYAYTRT